MMAISTQTDGILEFYNQKIISDKKQLDQINFVQSGYTIQTGMGATEYIRVWGPSEQIENYNYPIEKLDNRIVVLNTQISNLQSEVLSVGQIANSVGCGTAVWSVGYTTVTVLQDEVRYRGYSFTGSNPFSSIQGTLTTSNLGIGTVNYTTQVAIGSYFDPVGTCSDPLEITCNATICSGYATSITNLNSTISNLQTERNNLIVKVNFLKNGRIQPQLQNYAYNRSKQQISASIGISSSIISFLEDPNNSEWL